MEPDGGRDRRIEISLLVRLAIDIQTSISRRASIRQKKRQPVTFVSIVRAHVCQYVSWTTSSRSKNVRSVPTFPYDFNVGQTFPRLVCVSPAARPSTPPRWIADNFVFEMLTLPTIIDANRVYDRWIQIVHVETSKKHRKWKVKSFSNFFQSRRLISI